MRDLARIGSDPDEAWCLDVPRSIRRHAAFGLTLMAVAFGGFGAWAFGAPLAAAVIAPGSFVATGNNKILQHLEGGIIKEILVAEGEEVAAGDVLVRLDETAARANGRELELRRHRLEATEARLLAEHAEEAVLVFPEHLEEAREDAVVDTILASQTFGFNVSRRALDQDLVMLTLNAGALEARRIGYETQLDSHRRQVEILEREFAVQSGLLERGLARRPELASLERAIVEAEGQIGRLEAEIREIAEAQRRYETQIEKARSDYREAALDELQSVQAELESVREQARKAEAVLERAEIVAPVAGTVVRLYYHTAGGVIESGKAILELLPSGAPLIIEAQIPRTEIDSVRIGQKATVRLTALNQRVTPVLEGEVAYVSADAVAGEERGEARDVYVARVTLAPEQLRRVRGFAPTPGMPAEIMIQTEARTFAQYLVKPISDSMTRAFRED
jgi:HlyD family secretion protein